MKFNSILLKNHSINSNFLNHSLNQTLLFSVVHHTIHTNFQLALKTSSLLLVQNYSSYSQPSVSNKTFSMNLYQHLQNTKKGLREGGDKGKTTTLVLGNETADLDSMVSALFYSYLATITSPDKNRQYIPLINLNREDFKLKTDCIYPLVNYFNSEVKDKEMNYETCSQELVFRDDLTPSVLDSLHSLQVVLVDHNRLCYDFEQLLSQKDYAVESIIDHHVDEHKYQPSHLKIIDMVGSTVSLITRLYQQESETQKELFQSAKIDTAMAKLFLAPILIDSVNLNRQYHRTTDTDEQSADYLKGIIVQDEPDFDTNTYYQLLKENKHRIADLSVYDLIRKDFKKYFNHPQPEPTAPQNYFYGISSISRWCIEDLIQASGQQAEIIASMKQWMQKQNLRFHLIMASHLDGDIFKRELFFLFDDTFDREVEARIIQGIEASEIECTPIHKDEAQHIYIYRQKNLKYSRKVLQPFLQQLL